MVSQFTTHAQESRFDRRSSFPCEPRASCRKQRAPERQNAKLRNRAVCRFGSTNRENQTFRVLGRTTISFRISLVSSLLFCWCSNHYCWMNLLGLRLRRNGYLGRALYPSCPLRSPPSSRASLFSLNLPKRNETIFANDDLFSPTFFHHARISAHACIHKQRASPCAQDDDKSTLIAPPHTFVRARWVGCGYTILGASKGWGECTAASRKRVALARPQGARREGSQQDKKRG